MITSLHKRNFIIFLFLCLFAFSASAFAEGGRVNILGPGGTQQDGQPITPPSDNTPADNPDNDNPADENPSDQPGDNPAPPADEPGSQLDLQGMVKQILTTDLEPLLHIATTVSYLIGLIFIIMGMTRLYRHGSGMQNMMHRTSPASTAMFFVSGVVLISFMPYLQMISGSIFHLDAQSVLMSQCTGTDSLTGFQTSNNDFCPMLAYSSELTDAGADASAEALKYLIFGVLFLVGIISFIRGMIQLVKIGEGGGQGQGVGKAFTHLFAGIIAVNADSFYSFVQNILNAHMSS